MKLGCAYVCAVVIIVCVRVCACLLIDDDNGHLDARSANGAV